MPNYRRAFVPGGCWFFRLNLLDRRQGLLVDHADARSAAEETRTTSDNKTAAHNLSDQRANTLTTDSMLCASEQKSGD
jgi:hypothetical protein